MIIREKCLSDVFAANQLDYQVSLNEREDLQRYLDFIFPDYIFNSYLLSANIDTSTNLESLFPNRYQLFSQLIIPYLNNQGLDYKSFEELTNQIESLNNVALYILDRHVKSEAEPIMRPNQLPFFLKLYHFLESNNKSGALGLPTGAGKTVIYLELIRAYLGEKNTLYEDNDTTQPIVLVTVPTLNLIDQTLAENIKFPPELNIGVIKRGVTSNERTLAAQNPIILTTYQSLKHLPDLLNDRPVLFIADEGHHSRGRNTVQLLNKLNIIKEISISATPPADIPVIDSVDLLTAVDQEMICPYSVVAVEVETTVDHKQNQHELETIDIDHNLQKPMGKDLAALQIFQEHFSDLRGYIFCQGISHAERVAQLFIDNKINAAAVSSRTAISERERINLAWDRGDIDLLVCADLFVEGDNRPEAALVINLSQTRSPRKIVQMSGRALRFLPGKKAYVVQIDEINDPHTHFGHFVSVNYIPNQGTYTHTDHESTASVNMTDWQNDPRLVLMHNAAYQHLRISTTIEEFRRMVPKESRDRNPNDNIRLMDLTDLCQRVARPGIVASTVFKIAKKFEISYIETTTGSKTSIEFAPSDADEVVGIIQKLAHPPSGWKSAAMLRDEINIELGLKKKKDAVSKVAKNIYQQKRLELYQRVFEANPDADKDSIDIQVDEEVLELRDIYYGTTVIVDYYCPEICELVRQHFLDTEAPLAPEGWLSIEAFAEMLNVTSRTSIRSYMNRLRTKKPKWFMTAKSTLQDKAGLYISPDAQNNYKQYRTKGEREEQSGKFVFANDAARQLSISIQSLEREVKKIYTDPTELEKHWKKMTRSNTSEALYISQEALTIIAQLDRIKNRGLTEGERMLTDVADEINISEHTLKGWLRDIDRGLNRPTPGQAWWIEKFDNINRKRNVITTLGQQMIMEILDLPDLNEKTETDIYGDSDELADLAIDEIDEKLSLEVTSEQVIAAIDIINRELSEDQAQKLLRYYRGTGLTTFLFYHLDEYVPIIVKHFRRHRD